MRKKETHPIVSTLETDTSAYMAIFQLVESLAGLSVNNEVPIMDVVFYTSSCIVVKLISLPIFDLSSFDKI